MPRSDNFQPPAHLAHHYDMSDDEYEIPLQDQRVFGAGIKRKRVKFVPSSEAAASPLPTPLRTSTQSVSDLYLRLVLPQDSSPAADTLESVKLPSVNSEHAGSGAQSDQDGGVCQICNLPFSSLPTLSPKPDSSTTHENKPRPHEASLAHQVCLTHSHPPSHLDRNRKGLSYLSAYGWDPDARRGLGAEGQGTQFPIKAKPKDDKMGIGVVLPKEADRRKKEKLEKLDAKKVRKLQEKDRKKSERLREMFYRNDDIERYLGGG